MKRMTLLVSFLALSTAFAADMPKPELLLIHEEVVKPAGVMAYEATSKDFMAALAEKKFSSPALTFTTAMTSDFHYVYAVQLDSFAALDNSMAEWARAREAVGASRWDDLERRGNETMSSYSEFVLMRRRDLSYMPANPRVSMAERRYVRWDTYYIEPTKMKEAEAIARDYVALF